MVCIRLSTTISLFSARQTNFCFSDTIATLRSNKTGGNVEMVVGFNSSHPLLRLYSVENGLSALAGFTSPDPKRPPDLAFDGSLFSYGATTTDCHPCVMAVQLPEVYVVFSVNIGGFTCLCESSCFVFVVVAAVSCSFC